MDKKFPATLSGPAKIGGKICLTGSPVMVTEIEIAHLIAAKALPQEFTTENLSVELDEGTEDGLVVIDEKHPLFADAMAWAQPMIDAAVEQAEVAHAAALATSEALMSGAADEILELQERLTFATDAKDELVAKLETVNGELEKANEQIVELTKSDAPEETVKTSAAKPRKPAAKK